MRLTLRRAIAMALLASCVGSSANARGDDAREASRGAFRRGVAAVKEGNYAAARDSFAEAYKLFAHPSILLNLGIARWRTGDLVDAERDLARFLSDDGGASTEEIASARAALAAVRDRLGTLRLRVSPDSAHARLDGKALALAVGGFVDVRAVAGSHALVVEAEGRVTANESVVITATRASLIDLTLRPLDASAAPLRDARGEPRGDRATAGFILIGVAAVSAGVGSYCGVRALGLASDYDTRGGAGFQDASTRSEGIALRTAADVAFAASIVGAGIGAYLLLVRPRANDGAAAATALALTPGFAGVRASF